MCIRDRFNPQLGIEGILLTMYDARTNLCAQVVQEVREHFPEEAFETMIDVYKRQPWTFVPDGGITRA